MSAKSGSGSEDEPNESYENNNSMQQQKFNQMPIESEKKGKYHLFREHFSAWGVVGQTEGRQCAILNLKRAKKLEMAGEGKKKGAQKIKIQNVKFMIFNSLTSLSCERAGLFCY